MSDADAPTPQQPAVPPYPSQPPVPPLPQQAPETVAAQYAAAGQPEQPVAPEQPAAAPYGQPPAPPYPYAQGPEAQAYAPYGQAPEGAYQQGQPYGAPVAPPQTGMSKGLLIGLIAGGVGLVVVIIVVVAVFASMLARGSGGSAGAPAGADPAETATAYLEALADSDAEAALALLSEAPGDDTFLTDDVLEESNAAAPMTDIQVESIDDAAYYATLPVTYSLGDIEVSAEVSLSQNNQGQEWKIENGVNDLLLGSRFEGMEMTLNGVAVEDGAATVFPGTYVLGTTTPYFEITGTTTITVKDGWDFPTFDDVQPALTAEGLTVFQTAINDAVNACIASKTLTAGCGLDVPQTLDDGTVLVDGTLTRTLSSDAQAALAHLEPEPSYGEPLQVRSPYLGVVDITAECDKNGSRGTCELLFGPSLGSALVDFRQDPITVLWD